MSAGSEDWADGIAKPVRELLDGGASDEHIERFIGARREGRLDLAREIFLSAAQRASDGVPLNSERCVNINLQKLIVAALRPVVNSLPTEQLHRYVHFVHQAAELLIESHQDRSIWESKASLEAAASSLGQAGLKFLNAR